MARVRCSPDLHMIPCQIVGISLEATVVTELQESNPVYRQIKVSFDAMNANYEYLAHTIQNKQTSIHNNPTSSAMHTNPRCIGPSQFNATKMLLSQ